MMRACPCVASPVFSVPSARRCAVGCVSVTHRSGESRSVSACSTAHMPFLERRGGRMPQAAQLWRELVALGFNGRPTTVRAWATGRRRRADRYPPGRHARHGNFPARRGLARLLMADTHALGETERAFVVQLLTDAPDLAKAVAAAKNLRRVLRRDSGEGLEAALATAASIPPRLRLRPAPRRRRGAGSTRASLDDQPGRRPDQPPQDDQADHVRPSRLRSSPRPRPPCRLIPKWAPKSRVISDGSHGSPQPSGSTARCAAAEGELRTDQRSHPARRPAPL